MPKKKSRVPKSGPVWHRTAEQATLDQMPKYNAHACGIGAHGDTKYNRAKQKRNWQRDLNREDARTRGRLPYMGQPPWCRACLALMVRAPRFPFAPQFARLKRFNVQAL